MELSVNGKKMQKYLLQIFRHFFIRIATVKSFQSSRLFQTILSNYYYWNAFFKSIRESYMWEMWYPNNKA